MSKLVTPSPLQLTCVDYLDYKTGSQLDPEFNPEGFDIQEFLERSRENERQRLEDELDRIEDQLEQREILHEDILEELGSKLDWYIERLEEVYKRPVSSGSGDKEELKSRIKEFYREIRKEKQRQWRDKQELQQERRKLIREKRELNDADDTLNLI